MAGKISPSCLTYSSPIAIACHKSKYYPIIYSRNTKPVIDKALIKKILMESLWTFPQNSNVFPEKLQVFSIGVE